MATPDVTRRFKPANPSRDNVEAVLIIAALVIIGCCCGGTAVGTLWAVFG